MAGGGYSSVFKPSAPGRVHVFAAKAIGATAWFWMMYRIREDAPVVLGWRHPWDGHGHGLGHDDHGDSHGHH